MLARTLQTLISLTVLVGLYAMYRFLVVPWIVPAALPVGQENVVIQETRTPVQIERLKRYFKEGDWETDQPIVIEKSEFALLLQNYENTAEDQLRIKPCTFVFFPDGRPSAGDDKRVFIMRAPEGAVLDFEGGCDLSRANVGRLQGGRLLGQVSITGHLSDPSPDAELSLVTRDVELREDRLWSRQEVQFRIGHNHGRGREMQMQFNLDNSNTAANTDPAMQTVERFELLRDVKLFVQLDSKHFLPENSPSAQDGTKANQTADHEASPVEIQCAGAFRLNLDEMAATFNEQVEVIRHHNNTPPDQLTCDQLTVYFTNKSRAESALPAAKISNQIEATKIVAQGNPVLVETPATGAKAQGNYLEIELDRQHLILQGNQPVTLTQNSSVLTAMDIDFTAGKEGELGTLKAIGPGRLVTVLAGAKQESLEATWKNSLELQPHKRGHVLSLVGSGRIQYANTSALQAEKIWLWVDKVSTPEAEGDKATGQPSAPAWKQFSPHSALAIEKVRLHGEKLSAVSDRLEVWFENHPPVDKTLNPTDSRKSSSLLGFESRPSKNSLQPGPSPQNGQPENHYHIRGDLIQLTIALPKNGQPSPTNASVSGNVQLVERFAKPSSDAPLTASGDHLDLFGADTMQTVVSLTGKPARATARAASITGALLQLERGTNRIWVDGAGSMRLPIDRDLQGTALTTPEPLDITWQGKMLFDGQLISFEQHVFAKTKNQQLQTAQLAVILNRRLDLSERIERDTVDVAKIACQGGVLLENYSREEGRQISHERLETKDLIIEQPSGHLRAQGPGTVTSVRRGSASDNPLSLTRTPPPKKSSVEPTSQKRNNENELGYVRIEFFEGLEGNIQDRELTFNEQVHCTYGPVKQWEDQVRIDPAIGPRGNEVLLTCKQLTVRQMGSSKSAQRAMEMEALGNAHVDGETFSANGHRLTYTTGKELLVLEGRGQSFAQLMRRQHESEQSSNLTAQKIYFWRADNRVQLEGIRLFNGSLPNRE